MSCGQSAAHAVVTSISNLVETSKMVVISHAWVHPRSQANKASGVEWKKEHQLKSSNFANNWPIFTIESSHPITFSSENYYSDCIGIVNTFIGLAERTVAIILWQDMATDCVKPKTNTTPFEMTRRDKISHWANIPDDTAAGQPGWSTEVLEM